MDDDDAEREDADLAALQQQIVVKGIERVLEILREGEKDAPPDTH